VSVILLCFNHQQFVEEALESIRRQTFGDYELIIVDDCSQDSTVATVQEYLAKAGLVASLVAHRVNRGVCASLNDALSIAAGDYVAVLSADDRWLPEKLATQVQLLDDLPESVGVIYSDAYRIDEDGQVLAEKFISFHDAAGRVVVNPPSGNIFGCLLQGNFIPATATLIRNSCYSRVGHYDEELPIEDWDMWLRISRTYDFAFCEEPTTEYRELSTSLSTTLHHMSWYRSHLKIVSKHLGISPEIDRTILRSIRDAATVKYCTGAIDARQYWADARGERYRASTVLKVMAHIMEPRLVGKWRRAMLRREEASPYGI
jgi:glycosyltransferase involved in cell wall biosynthesis